MTQPSARAKRADQKRYSKAEMKDGGETGTVREAVRAADSSFESRIQSILGKAAYVRLAFSARTRKMKPVEYARKVLLK